MASSSIAHKQVLRHLRSRVLAGIAASFLVSTPVLAETITMSPAEMRAAVSYALELGDSEMALRLSDALLERDPKDGFALVSRSRAARNLGKNELAISTAQMAWDTSTNAQNKYAAAVVMAQALSSDGKRTRAQLWLRRAAQHAPNDHLKAIVARDFKYVRSRNPWSTHLSFGAAPSSNINNGSKSDTMVISGLPFTLSGAAQALSGMEYSFSASTRYRRPVSERLRLNFGAAVETKSYSLSASARKKAPGLSASDLAYQAAQVSFGADWAQENGRLGAEITLGQSYYGGDPLSDFAQLELRKTLITGDRSALSFSVSTEEQWRKDRAIKSSTSHSGQMGWQRKQTNGDRLSLSLGLREVDSASADIAHSAQLAAIGYNFAKPVLGAHIGLNMVYEARNYDRPAFGNAPREDDKVSVGATAVLPKLGAYGFAPEIGISAVRNKSSLPLYDSEDLNMTIGFRSAF